MLMALSLARFSMQLAEIRAAQIFRTNAFLLHSRYWRTDIVWRHWWCSPVELPIVCSPQMLLQNFDWPDGRAGLPIWSDIA